ncbi:MAG: hypothetical protein IT176_03105 [Acidobacteria bacterium]|nr:hypothetical protein [Acidobacteriota bacterium]
MHVALYPLLFPQLVAGPIIRCRDLADRLPCRVVSLDGFATGVRDGMEIVGRHLYTFLASPGAGGEAASPRP